MVRRLSERTQAIVFLVVLCTGLAGLYGWVQASQPRPVPVLQVTGVSLAIDGASWAIQYGPVTTTNNTAFAILKEASQRLHFSLNVTEYSVPSAVFVNMINGSWNGQGGLYWQYWVNGTYGNVGADHYGLSDGSQVLWRFTTNQEGG